MDCPFWKKCLHYLDDDSVISPENFNLWIRPLECSFEEEELSLLAPNFIVFNEIKNNFLPFIQKAIQHASDDMKQTPKVRLSLKEHILQSSTKPSSHLENSSSKINPTLPWTSNLNSAFTFDNYVKGKSNQLAHAAALQVAESLEKKPYNPLVIYGDVGLGKTHLMQAVGHAIIQKKPEGRVLYIHSERFVTNMVEALRHDKMEAFKNMYRNVHAILVDDIQFFSGKERSQEEFFHTLNALLDSNRQIILTSDRYPKDLAGLDERLKSRFVWGLSVGVDPPELETRVAILMNKAAQSNMLLPEEIAFFIAQRFRSNVRELEGVLKRIIANAHFTGKMITLAFVKDTLKDLFNQHMKWSTMDNIQKVVAEHYKISLVDLLSNKRHKSLSFPRQVAMTLCKELTEKSLPEIGKAFGGKDHTTVLYAFRKIKKIQENDPKFHEIYKLLIKILST